MRDLEITPSPVTLGILVKTYGQAGDIQKVLQVWDEMEKQRGLANAVTYGCMIDACVKCNHLHKAVEIFQGMRETGKHRNTILYTTLIKGYGLDKNLQGALQLFREMPREGVPYNTITYNSIIDACVKSQDLATAESLLQEITSHQSGLEPDLITFSTLLKGYCHAGDLDKALQLAEAIKARGLRCDELVYNTLMDGCVKANDVSAGVGLFEEMVYNGMRPSAITHSILARLYQRAGYEDDATEAVAQLYQHHGIERPTGGERGGKGYGRNRGTHRSPLGSPTASPMTGYGLCSDGGWNSWGDNVYDGYAHSTSSTPCASPMHSIGGNANGFFLPMDAMRAVPPMPGMPGAETPYGSSCGGTTPVSNYCSIPSSPYMSPTGQMQMIPTNSAPMPTIPSFPFAGGPGQVGQAPTMGACQMTGLQQGVAMPQADAQTQYFTLPTVQQQGHPMPPPVQPAGMAQGAGGASPASFGPVGNNQAWQGRQSEIQQSPFPMPLSPPHDLAQHCTPSQQPQQSQQAYFEFMPNNVQGANVQMSGPNDQNPFCL